MAMSPQERSKKHYADNKERILERQRIRRREKREEILKYQRNYRETNQDKIKSKNDRYTALQCIDGVVVPSKSTLTRYKVTVNDYLNFYEMQGGACAICREPFDYSAVGTRPVIDHNHDTGTARGILHSSCNVAMGGLKDSPELLKRAAHYLEVSNARH